MEYDEVDDADLDPATARLQGDTLRVDGVVAAGGILRRPSVAVSPRFRVTITLCIAPVSRWRLVSLDRGTGAVIPGDFRTHERGGRVVGVIPGDLIVESSRRPAAWFETTATQWNGAALSRPTPPPPVGLSASQRAGLLLGTFGVLSGMVALLSFFALLAGLGSWDWDLQSDLTVRVGRLGWAFTIDPAWHYLLPVGAAQIVGIVGFLIGMMGAIHPRRAVPTR